MDSLNIITNVPPELFRSVLARPRARLVGDPRELAVIEVCRLCPVCYNLDPRQALSDGDSHKSSWAKEEYRISDDTPVAMITISKSKELFQAAQGGCLYCVMIANALEAAHPGWQTEDTFLQIFLAAGLPVFVRLTFGATSQIPMDRETAYRMGYQVPEGQQMFYSVRFLAHGKEAVDIEIYRPVIPESQRIVADVLFEPLVQNMGFAKDIQPNAGDPGCFDFIKQTVDMCVKHHTCGKDRVTFPLLPDRIIWIEVYNDSGIQLVESPQMRARYIALSYCWGPVHQDVYLTTAQTLPARKSGMRQRDLPLLFQDVIKTARVLGIAYVWIDRLCIIQGDEKDFQTQAPKLGEIYGNATLTIAAASATTENDGILTSREYKCSSTDCSLAFEGVTCIQARSRRLWHPLGKESKGGEYGKISTRAWVWQERLLAARTVFFTPGGVKFECRHHSVWEGFHEGRTGHSWSTQLGRVTLTSWIGLVEEYMRRGITRPTDRLHAIEAVVKRVQRVTNWSLRKAGVFSRIGISYGLPPDAFANAKRMEVEIV